MRQFMITKIRPLALTLLAPGLGFFLLLLLELGFKIEASRLLSSIINLIIVAPVAFLLFPRVLGIPFGRVAIGVYLKKLGFFFPQNAWKHVLLGLVLAACTLSGMLIGSLLSGEFVLDVGRIEFQHLVFSLNPGIWEELFYRGVMMVLLLQFTRSFKKAFLIQVVIFSLAHIKGFDVWAFVDVLTVFLLAVGFTFVAQQTRSLLAGIIFHYLHDALLFFVQVPDGVELSVGENLVFFGCLWLMVGVVCLFTWLAAGKLGVRASEPLYQIDSLDA